MEKATNNKKIEWIEGMRALACLMIVLHHFLLAFYPETYYGNAVESNHSSSFAIWWSQAPISVLTNGNFWVCVFLLISAYILSIQVFRKDDIVALQKMVFKRYFRIALPMFVISCVVQIMLMLRVFSNQQLAVETGSEWLTKYYTSVPALYHIITVPFGSVLFSGNNIYSTAFWMIKYIFIGSYLAYLLSLMGREKRKYIYLFYILVLVAFARVDWYYCTVALGVMLAHSVHYQMTRIPSWMGYVFLILGLWFGGYPSGVKPDNAYRMIEGVGFIGNHVIGAFFLVAGIVCASGVQKFLSVSGLVKLGRISFAVYLVHIPILFSVSSSLFLAFVHWQLGYHLSTLLVLIATYALVLLIAYLFEKYIERNCGRFIDWIERKM